MLGDITGPDGTPDGKVDLKDIWLAAKAFGTKPGDKNWNSNADINGDVQVSLSDIFIIAKNFGKTV